MDQYSLLGEHVSASMSSPTPRQARVENFAVLVEQVKAEKGFIFNDAKDKAATEKMRKNLRINWDFRKLPDIVITECVAKRIRSLE